MAWKGLWKNCVGGGKEGGWPGPGLDDDPNEPPERPFDILNHSILNFSLKRIPITAKTINTNKSQTHNKLPFEDEVVLGVQQLSPVNAQL